MDEETIVRTINITPTWEGIVLQLAVLYTEAVEPQARAYARGELLRLARFADSSLIESKKMRDG